MSLIIPVSKWVQDPGIADLIAYFNEPVRFKKWGKLTDYEQDSIEREILKCRDDFCYAARNYFMITTKKGEERMFSLWESQELIYELIMRLRSMGVAQKILIIKARQLGCSTLIEGLIAWGTIYFPGVNAMVTSYDPDHAAYLFGIMQFIYDRLPWWMQPMCASREYKDGLLFENPKYDERGENPGLNSSVIVQAANKMTGIGTGRRISMFHGSEFALWLEDKARKIIEKDVGHALPENAKTLAVLESTAQGAGRYAHRLWLNQVKLAERAAWVPIFLPSFFDRTHFIAPSDGWEPKKEEIQMSERVERDWVRCDDRQCLQFQDRYFQSMDRVDTQCPTCRAGTLRSYALSAGFMNWMETKRENAQDEEAIATLRQEACVTAEEAFQISGQPVFGGKAQEWANATVMTEPLIRAVFDKNGIMHGIVTKTGTCPLDGCTMRHFGEDMPLSIYRLPDINGEYTMGGDVASGDGGKSDSSVASIIKVNRHGGLDEQVAVFSSNTIPPIAFAKEMDWLGRMYNNALAAPEINKYDTACTQLSFHLQYPNMYRMRNMEAMASNRLSMRAGWNTTVASKPRIFVTMMTWLRERLLVLRDRTTVEEMKTFVKEEVADRSASAADTFHDDHIMATMIALYIAHELDYNDALGTADPKRALTLETCPWIMNCRACGHVWPANEPQDFRNCTACYSMHIGGKQNFDVGAPEKQDPYTDIVKGTQFEEHTELAYESL